jgi:Skp family chaperone for outer membrane proteins
VVALANVVYSQCSSVGVGLDLRLRKTFGIQEVRTMRNMLRTGGVLLVFGMVALVGRSLSETKPEPAPRTRIALVNLAEVSKAYSKVHAYSTENKKLMEPYSEKAKEIQGHIVTLVKALEDKELPIETREDLEKKLKVYQRKLDEVSHDAKMLYAKKDEEQMVIVYKEIMEAAQHYARKHDIDLVMHYNDVPPDQPDFYSPVNVSRKIHAGACIPMVIAPGMDISKTITAELNKKYDGAKKPAEPDEK